MAAADTYRFDPIAEQHDHELDGVATEELINALDPWQGENEFSADPVEIAPEVEETIVRHLLLRYASNEKKSGRLQALLVEIARPYRSKIDKLDAEQNGIRDVIRSWLIRRGVNSLEFPGLYRPTLSTKCKGGKAKVVDVDALAAHLDEGGLPIPYKKPAVDGQAAIELLVTERLLDIRADGTIVATDTGEVVEIPGVLVEPESKTIQLRGAA